MRRLGTRAGDVGVQPFHPVREPLRHQEVERAVGHGWLRGPTFGTQHVQDVVGAHRAMLADEDVQHPRAHRRETRALGRPGGGGGAGAGRAGGVVVGIERHDAYCYIITLPLATRPT